MCLLPAPAVGVLVCETQLLTLCPFLFMQVCSVWKHHSEPCVCQEWARLVAVTNTYSEHSICSTTLVLPFVHFLFFPLATSSLFLLPPLSQALPNPNPNPDPVIHYSIIFAHNKDNYFLHSVRLVQCLA